MGMGLTPTSVSGTALKCSQESASKAQDSSCPDPAAWGRAGAFPTHLRTAFPAAYISLQSPGNVIPAKGPHAPNSN